MKIFLLHGTKISHSFLSVIESTLSFKTSSSFGNLVNYKPNKLGPIKENILHRKQRLFEVNMQNLGN